MLVCTVLQPDCPYKQAHPHQQWRAEERILAKKGLAKKGLAEKGQHQMIGPGP